MDSIIKLRVLKMDWFSMLKGKVKKIKPKLYNGDILEEPINFGQFKKEGTEFSQ